jgi:hypothetical protein
MEFPVNGWPLHGGEAEQEFGVSPGYGARFHNYQRLRQAHICG